MDSVSRQDLLRGSAAVLVSALLLASGYMPVGGLWFGPVVFVALCPLVAVTVGGWGPLSGAGERGRVSAGRAVVLSFLCGYVFFAVCTSWLGGVTVAGWLGLSGYLAVYFVFASIVLRVLHLSLRLPMWLALGLAWTCAEFVRSRLFGGFPWLMLGHSQHAWVTFIQIADLGGVPLVTAVVAVINGLVYDCWLSIRSGTGRFRRAAPYAAGIAVVLLMVNGYGFFRVLGSDFTSGPLISLVQADIAQDAKNDPSMTACRRSFQRHIQLSRRAVDEARAAGEDPRMVVWPETMITAPLLHSTRRWPREMRNRLTDLARRKRCDVLLGANHVPEGSSKLFNSVFHITPSGGADAPAARYDKMHLVPFGEYVPFRDQLPFLAPIVPYQRGFSAGTRPIVFEVDDTRFGALVCFEDAFPQLSAMYFREGRSLDFLVNLSNDGWFGGSYELEQHLAIARFRAVEFRVPLIRATNTGISCFIDSNGRLQSVIERRERRKQVSGCLTDRVMLDDRKTLYLRCGDVFAWAIVFAAVLLVTAGRLRQRNHEKTR